VDNTLDSLSSLSHTLGTNGLSPRALAFLGDAVYSLAVRDWLVRTYPADQKALHARLTKLACAQAQATLLLDVVQPLLTEDELALVKQGRNAPVSVGRRHMQKVYRNATSLEVLLGYLHLNNKLRLQTLWQEMETWLKLQIELTPPT
jgi:ribonuclease III family protein